MAILRQRLHKKNNSDEYDTVYLETLASLCKMTNGQDLETVVNSKANSDHTHTQYAATGHLHDDRYSLTSHSHSNYVTTGVWWNSYANLAALKSGLGLNTDANTSITKMTFGTYNGDGATSEKGKTYTKTITVGFQPKVMIITAVGCIAPNGGGAMTVSANYALLYIGQSSDLPVFGGGSYNISRSYTVSSTGITITVNVGANCTNASYGMFYMQNENRYLYGWLAFG